MNDNNNSRRDIEQAMTSAIKRDAEIVGAVLVGSMANGTADAFSDLDYYLYVRGSWWTRRRLELWLREAGLSVNLHYWTGVAKHHLLVNGIRTDITVWSKHQQAELGVWPHLFFPRDSIIKDVQGRLAAGYDANPQVDSYDHVNDYAAYVLNLMMIAAQLCRGEDVNARNRFMSVVEAKARLLQDLSFGTALWREPTRHVEENLPSDQVDELSRLTYLGTRDELIRWIVEELDLTSRDDALDPQARSAALAYSQHLQTLGSAQRTPLT